MGRTRRQAQCRPRNRLRQVLSDGNAPVSSARRLHCASVSAATSQAGGATSAGGRARTIRRPPAPWSSSRDARHPLPEKFPVPGSVERMGRSVLVVPWPVRLHQLLLHLRGPRFVVAEIQRIATAPGGDRLEFGRVAFQARKGVVKGKREVLV